MKKVFMVLCAAAMFCAVSARDVIHLQDGSEIRARVLKSNANEIRVRNSSGQVSNIPTTQVKTIKYADGRRVHYNRLGAKDAKKEAKPSAPTFPVAQKPTPSVEEQSRISIEGVTQYEPAAQSERVLDGKEEETVSFETFLQQENEAFAKHEAETVEQYETFAQPAVQPVPVAKSEVKEAVDCSDIDDRARRRCCEQFLGPDRNNTEMRQRRDRGEIDDQEMARIMRTFDGVSKEFKDRQKRLQKIDRSLENMKTAGIIMGAYDIFYGGTGTIGGAAAAAAAAGFLNATRNNVNRLNSMAQDLGGWETVFNIVGETTDGVTTIQGRCDDRMFEICVIEGAIARQVGLAAGISAGLALAANNARQTKNVGDIKYAAMATRAVALAVPELKLQHQMVKLLDQSVSSCKD